MFNVEVLQEFVTGKYTDFLFLSGPIQLSIFGIPQVYVMFAMALIYVYSLYFLNYLLLGKIKFENGIILQHDI